MDIEYFHEVVQRSQGATEGNFNDLDVQNKRITCAMINGMAGLLAKLDAASK